MIATFNRHTLSKKQWLLLFGIAFLIRALVMYFFIQPYGFYKQADSVDYHNCALSVAKGNGMHRLDSHTPIFWRTPGYPPYIAWFYSYYGIPSFKFEDCKEAQESSIWFQIFFASWIPIILYYLAYALTLHDALSLVVAWIAVFHPGLVLASTYLLSEGIALIFFYVFLYFFYRLLFLKQSQPWMAIASAAVLTLSAYTWIRPMGEFVGVFSAIILLCACTGMLRHRLHKSVFFIIFFCATLFPWYVRNYQLTGEWFFCPTIGTYLNVFSAPKIVRRTTGKPLLECHKLLQQQAALAVHKKTTELQGTGKFVSNNVCKSVSYPIIASHPFYFMYDWIVEVLKTTFDLYSYQIIPMLDNSYWYDPLEEYLPEKIAACLYTHSMHWTLRLVCFLEFIFNIFLWIGLLAGLWLYVIRALIHRKYSDRMLKVWLTVIPMIGIIVGMTGGFGYARLRLPAEPLIIILALTYWLRNKRKS